MQAFNSKEVELVKLLRPMKSSKTLSGGAKLKFVNGVLFISSTQSTEWAKMYHFEP